jgi:hypothetical protein
LRDCNSTYKADALRYLGDQTFSIEGKGCTQHWLIAVGTSEQGNVTEEATWFNQHNASFQGVILDDAGSGGLPYVASFNSSNVCVILYTPSTLTAPCVVLVVSLAYFGNTTLLHEVSSRTESQWEAYIGQSLVNVHANRILLLEYAQAPSSWHSQHGPALPIPPAYTEAVAASARAQNDTLVVWY